MSLTITKTRTPVQFELIDKQDDRFQKAKIRIAHTGENLNNSYFSKETLNSMKSSLANIPIVAFIEKDENGEDDFSNHRQEITVKDGDVSVRYAGHAYGFIPEDNNADFEIYGGKEWLVCEGYLWTKFQDAMSIFDESNGVKSQSMEIENVSGEVDDLGRLVISDGKFSALCILGDDVQPAMTGSTVELYSTKLNNREVDVMMSEFAELKKKKGGNGNVNDETNETKKEEEVDGVVTNPSDSKDTELEGSDKGDTDTGHDDDTLDASADGDTHEDVSSDSKGDDNIDHTDSDSELDGKSDEALGGVGEEEEGETDPDNTAVDGEGSESEDSSHAEEAEGDSTDDVMGDEPPEDEDGDTTFTQIIGNKEFQLNHDDIRSKLYKVADSLVDEREYAYISEIFSDHAIVRVSSYGGDSNKYLKVNYSELEDSISLGEVEEIFPMFLSEKEKARIENNRIEVEQLNAQLKELTDYRNEIEYSKKKEIVEEFSELIGNEKVQTIEAKFNEMSIDEVEREVAFEVYSIRKDNLKNEADNEGVSKVTNFSTSKTGGRYGSLDVYFNGQ